MKKVTKEFEVYKFDELGEDAREFAIKDHIEFLLQVDWETEEFVPDYVQTAIDKAKEMKTDWFVGDYMYEYGQDMIELELQDHEYLIDGTPLKSCESLLKLERKN